MTDLQTKAKAQYLLNQVTAMDLYFSKEAIKYDNKDFWTNVAAFLIVAILLIIILYTRNFNLVAGIIIIGVLYIVWLNSHPPNYDHTKDDSSKSVAYNNQLNNIRVNLRNNRPLLNEVKNMLNDTNNNYKFKYMKEDYFL